VGNVPGYVKFEPLDDERIDPPPRRVLQRYLGLDPPTEFSTRQLREAGVSSATARQFASQAARCRLAVRVELGSHVAVDPSTAARAWALPD